MNLIEQEDAGPVLARPSKAGIGWAVYVLQEGKKVRRAGWNGKAATAGK